MPRRLIRHPQHHRARSLGWFATWWAETFVVHGRGGVKGQPVAYGDEYTGFIVDAYALDARGRRLYDSAFLSRPKGSDKSGLASTFVLLEAFAPVRFDRWAEGGETYEFLGHTYTYQEGEPIGKPVVSPLVRILATEEDQAGNVYDSVYFNLDDDGAPLHVLKTAYGVDVGRTRTILPDGGEILPSTVSSAAKDGGLETFVVFDETHLYTSPRLQNTYDTVSRNLDKRRAEGTWYLETTTMYEPGAESIAEDTYQYADAIEEGKARRARLLFDHRWADVASMIPVRVRDREAPRGFRYETDEEYEARLTAAFHESFGDAIAWNDPEGLLDSLFDPRRTEADTRRYFFNALVAASNSWMQVHEWSRIGLKQRRDEAAEHGEKLRLKPPSRGDEIALGFDGSRTTDATVLIGCRISDGYVFPIRIWEAPDTAEGKHWSVDRQAVDATVRATFKRFRVVAFFADPPLWQDYVDRWESEFGDQLAVKASPSKAIEFWTSRHTEMAKAVERTGTALRAGELIHGNDPTLTRHVMNARVWHRTAGDVIGKERKGSPKKMDAAIGMCLAVEGRARYRRRTTDSTVMPRRVR